MSGIGDWPVMPLARPKNPCDQPSLVAPGDGNHRCPDAIRPDMIAVTGQFFRNLAMQSFHPVVRWWFCVSVLVLAVSASSQAQNVISFGAKYAAGDKQRLEEALAARGSLDVVEKPFSEVV